VNVAKITRSLALLASLTLIAACSGGGGGSKGNPAAQGSNFDSGCNGFCATNNPANLTQADVGRIIAQAVFEAQSRSPATIAVTDRVGNVLGLFRMNGVASPDVFTIRSALVDAPSISGLENIMVLPSTYAAISKAITGSYLASEGNAFSTRTASQIIQEHFNPGVANTAGGPLFGVQFSQLPCSDLVTRSNPTGNTAGIGVGPQRAPLGLSADPGGFPIYKNGHPVGGIGVISDNLYGLDRDIGVDTLPVENDGNYDDEAIALAGQFGFAPPIDRLADRITVVNTSLRYSDTTFDDLRTNPQSAPSFMSITGGVVGDLVDDESGAGAGIVSRGNYFDATNGLLDGSTFGTGQSGIVPADSIDMTFQGFDAFVLSNAAGTSNSYPPTAGVAIGGGIQLTADEVTRLLRSALGVANQTRAQIRRPLDSQARVTISVVDTAGNILGIVRTRDAPLFGTDVSLQKARTATFFSSRETNPMVPVGDDPATVLSAEADVTYLTAAGGVSGTTIDFSVDYVGAAGASGIRGFLNDNTALNNGIAFADRSGGNLSRPYFPDGIIGPISGPFSKPFNPTTPSANQWSPFSNGLQLDLVLNQLVNHLVNGVNVVSCTASTRLANGIQIFPGSVPIYRNGVLIGGIGVSGDGIEQDDMISFLGTHRAGIAGVGNAPIGIRADLIMSGQLAGTGRQLRYVQCPQNPFINNNDENVCDGL